MVNASCSVYGCRMNSRVNRNLKFHRIPRGDKGRLWVEACRRPELLRKGVLQLYNMYVCGLHFGDWMYHKRKLKYCAFPTLNLPSHCLYSKGTQTPNYVMIKGDNGSNTPCYSISPPEETLLTRKLFFKGCDRYLKPNLSKVVKTLTYQRRKSKGYSKKLRSFALTVFYSNPQCYNFVSKFLSLPPKKNLGTAPISISTKITEETWGILSEAATQCLSSQDKECVLCMGRTSVKPGFSYSLKRDKIVGFHEVDDVQSAKVADYAFMLMLRSLTGDWKLPIGYAFIENNVIDAHLETWLIDTIKRLLRLGFKIRAIVSHLDSAFISFTQSKGITREKPFFEINGNQIFYIFDIPNIFKNIRDSLMEYNFEFNGKTANWETIHELYQIDKENLCRRVPKLSHGHIVPNKLQKYVVRFAAQVFSNSVKEALEYYVERGFIEPCEGTIELVDLMNNVFDLLNSYTLHTFKPYQRPYSGKDLQQKLLTKINNVLSNLIVKDKVTNKNVNASVKFIDAFIITITSVIKLQEDLGKEYWNNEFCLLTRKLNNECLDNYFTMSQKLEGKGQQLTCVQFERAFRKYFLCQTFQLYQGKKCCDNIETIITRYNEFVGKKSSKVIVDADYDEVLKALKTFKFPNQGKKEDSRKQLLNRTIFISNYLLRECIASHTCLTADGSLVPKLHVDEVKVPPAHFLIHCQDMDASFCKNFLSLIGPRIAYKFYDIIRKVRVQTKNRPCPCFPARFLHKLFVRMRILYFVKLNNKQLRLHKSRAERKPIVIALA